MVVLAYLSLLFVMLYGWVMNLVALFGMAWWLRLWCYAFLVCLSFLLVVSWGTYESHE